MPNGTPVGVTVDPYRAYLFKLDIQGLTVGHFTACSGLGVKVGVVPFREGGAGWVVRRLPGQVEYGDVTLHYGLTDGNSRAVWEWMQSVVKGTVVRRNVSIIQLDNDGVSPKMQWQLIRAWPSEWRAAPLDALGQEVAIESMTLVYEELTMG